MLEDSGVRIVVSLIAFFLLVAAYEVAINTLFAAYNWMAARRAQARGEETEWVETNNRAGTLTLIPCYRFIYRCFARAVDCRFEESERVGPYGASGLVIPEYRFRRFRFLPN